MTYNATVAGVGGRDVKCESGPLGVDIAAEEAAVVVDAMMMDVLHEFGHVRS
jgi:hypothetical protein